MQRTIFLATLLVSSAPAALADPWTGFRIGPTGSYLSGKLALDLELLPQPERVLTFALPKVEDDRIPFAVPEQVFLTLPGIAGTTQQVLDFEYRGSMAGIELGFDWRPGRGPIVLALAAGYETGSVKGDTATWYEGFGQRVGYGAKIELDQRVTLSARIGILPTESLLLFVEPGLEAVHARDLTGWVQVNDRRYEESTSGWGVAANLGVGAEWRPGEGQWSISATITPFRASLTESLVDEWVDGHLEAKHTTVQFGAHVTF